LRQRLDVPHRFPEQKPECPVQPAVEDEPEIAPLGEVNKNFDEPLLMPGFNEVDFYHLSTEFSCPAPRMIDIQE
jgi:hypothetical protein